MLAILLNAVGWVWTMFMSVMACVLGILFGRRGLRWAWLGLCRPWATGAIGMVGVKPEIWGRENLVGPAIFACNHQSLIDVVLLPALLPRRLKWVAKRELLRVPFWGWAFQGGAVFIDRSNPKEAMERIQRGIEDLPADWSIAIFPEGTRSKDGTLGTFKKGVVHMALRSRLPVVPLGLYGTHDVNPHKSPLVTPGRVHITAGPPICTDHWSAERIGEHLAEVRAAVLACVEQSRARHQEREEDDLAGDLSSAA